MGVVVEYETQRGEPQWIKPGKTPWDYSVFARNEAPRSPDETIHLKFEKVPGGRGGYNRWTINGKSWPDTIALSWTMTVATSTQCICTAIHSR